MNALREYLEKKRGRAVKLARELGVTPGAVTQWTHGEVPAERIFKISKLTKIPVRKLRPDLFDDHKIK